jgi:uncharacterized membrane-anchored protein
MSWKMRAVIAVVVLQLGVLVFMAGEREWVLRTGRTIYLRTAPIDPRDPMRGDYVRFGYEIGEVPRALCKDGVLTWMQSTQPSRRSEVDRRVYAVVRLDAEGVAELVSLSDRKPAEGIFLRGRVQSVESDSIRVRFGVEALFMQQGKALAFQNEQTARPGLQLNMELAVSDGGLAVIKGWRWEKLGLTIKRETVTEPMTNGRKNQRRETLRGLTVEWKNWSDQPVAILTGSTGTAWLRLVSAGRQWDRNYYRWVGEDRAPAPVKADELRVLKPGETHRVFVDLSEPQWFVTDTRKPGSAPVSLRSVENAWEASFRIEYAPPITLENAGALGGATLPRGRVRSAAFNP